MTAEDMFIAARRVATSAEAAAKGNYADARQVLHMALSVCHANENEAREAARAKAARTPGSPR